MQRELAGNREFPWIVWAPSQQALIALAPSSKKGVADGKTE
jgi:hypothetical protein